MDCSSAPSVGAVRAAAPGRASTTSTSMPMLRSLAPGAVPSIVKPNRPGAAPATETLAVKMPGGVTGLSEKFAEKPAGSEPNDRVTGSL